MRAFLEHSITLYRSGKLNILAHPKAQRMTLFPEGEKSSPKPSSRNGENHEWLDQAFSASTKNGPRNRKKDKPAQSTPGRWETRVPLCDSEGLTMEIVGEFLGIATDSGIYQYFRRHYREWFPSLLQVHRTTFVRQAANLWRVKQQVWQEVIALIAYDPLLSITDSLPIPVCRFARAYRCRILAGETAFGRDEVARQTFLGLRLHVRLSLPGGSLISAWPRPTCMSWRWPKTCSPG